MISVFGINYKSTALENLEHISFSTEDIAKSLPLLVSGERIKEGVIISTCNRTEIYTACQEGVPVQHILYDFIRTIKPACTEATLKKFYYKEGQKAVEHLFSVASSLDSLSIGENEIAGQVKEAYRIACEIETTGTLTNKLFHAAFKTSKRVKHETRINEGNCSIGCVAVELAERTFPDLQACHALLIGVGDIGKVVAKNLAQRGVKNITIANRNVTKAANLSEEVGATAISLDEISEHIEKMNLIVSGTGSQEYLFHYDEVKKLVTNHRKTPLLIVDIALPRDFEPEIGTLPNVLLKNLYDLQEVVDLNLKKREQEIPKVEKIIEEEVRKFLCWKKTLRIKPTIQRLTENFEMIRLIEVEKCRGQFPEENFPQVENLTKSLTNKYIHMIISNLKSLHEICSLKPGEIHIIQHLFDNNDILDESANCRSRRKLSRSEL